MGRSQGGGGLEGFGQTPSPFFGPTEIGDGHVTIILSSSQHRSKPVEVLLSTHNWLSIIYRNIIIIVYNVILAKLWRLLLISVTTNAQMNSRPYTGKYYSKFCTFNIKLIYHTCAVSVVSRSLTVLSVPDTRA